MCMTKRPVCHPRGARRLERERFNRDEIPSAAEAHMRRVLMGLALATVTAVSVHAQWLKVPTPGIPRD